VSMHRSCALRNNTCRTRSGSVLDSRSGLSHSGGVRVRLLGNGLDTALTTLLAEEP
jgi:hypothetical protein